MKNLFTQGPIVAISTGIQEKSALGIVRVSGVNDFSFLNDLTLKEWSIEPKKAYFSRFFDDFSNILDEGIFLCFQAPHSFTGENIVEFNLHGNPLLLTKFVDHLVDSFGFNRASPGEFSYRALKNKKLNLTQVEGLDLLLNANSSFGLSAGTKILHNDLFQEYQALRSTFLEMKASLELLIDFSEDVGEEEIKNKLNKDMGSFKDIIYKLYNRSQGRLDDLLAPTIGLFGQTNAGKSTFFNILFGDNRAIVSKEHGTTRDYVSEMISIFGQSYKLIDTAGLRNTEGLIEKEGIKRSLKLLESCFYKIIIVNPFDDYLLKEDYECDAIVLTHSDKLNFDDVSKGFLKNPKLKVFKKSGPMGAIETNGPIGPNKFLGGSIGAKESKVGPMGAALAISGPIEPGKALEKDIFHKYQALTMENPIPIERHRNEISAIYAIFNELSYTYTFSSDLAIISSIFNRLGSSLDQLIGVVSPQEVLDHIFSNFCIGK